MIAFLWRQVARSYATGTGVDVVTVGIEESDAPMCLLYESQRLIAFWGFIECNASVVQSLCLREPVLRHGSGFLLPARAWLTFTVATTPGR